MREISDSPKPDSNSGIISENRAAEEITGWETEVPSPRKRPKLSQLISLANDKLPLIDLLQSYKVHFSFVGYSPSGWTHKGQCPFPDHNDSNPSFNYNSVEDRINCFGCGRSGRAVQFKAGMHGLPLADVADTIIEQFSSLEDAYIEIKEKREDHSDELLLSFSRYINLFLDKYYSSVAAFQFAEDVSWSLDLFLLKHITDPMLNFDDLEARIVLLKDKLDNYHE